MIFPEVTGDVWQGGVSGSWRWGCPQDSHFHSRTFPLTDSLPTPYGAAYQKSGVKGGPMLIREIVFWSKDRNCIHKAIGKPDWRESTSELHSIQNREFPSGGAWCRIQRRPGWAPRSGVGGEEGAGRGRGPGPLHLQTEATSYLLLTNTLPLVFPVCFFPFSIWGYFLVSFWVYHLY